MNHELAKQLEDAGFPKYAGPPDVPDLEELIEACGVGFDNLERMADTNPVGKWAAWTRALQPLPKSFWGATPDEAVARLWLALHAKAL